MNLQLVAAKPSMVAPVLQNLRGDQVELVSEGTELSKDLIQKILVSSHCRVGLVDGQIAVMWGVLTPSITSGIGVVWAVTTKLADEYPLVFARRSKIELEKIRQSYSELTGYVRSDYKRSIRWLRWLGFEIGDSINFHGTRSRIIKMKGAL